MPKDTQMNRRSFMATGSAVVAGATLCSGCSIFASQAKPDLQLSAESGFMTLSIADSKKLAEKGSSLRMASPDGERRIFVVRGDDGQLVALSMVCTHWGSDVNYVPNKGHFICPSHGSIFGINGSVIEGPAGDPLERYKITEDEKGIRIAL